MYSDVPLTMGSGKEIFHVRQGVNLKRRREQNQVHAEVNHFSNRYLHTYYICSKLKFMLRNPAWSSFKSRLSEALETVTLVKVVNVGILI